MFQVKWIFIKDIGNNRLRHITLSNNENKPVTNSRDTQEILPDAGRKMLQAFAEYQERSSLLDEFDVYERAAAAVRDPSAPTVVPTPVRERGSAPRTGGGPAPAVSSDEW